MFNYIILLLGLCINLALSAQNKDVAWEKIDDSEELTIYFRKIPDSTIKELKLYFKSSASADEWINAIRNVETMNEWSYTCRSTQLLKRDERSVIFYYIADIPWPIKGRDVVLHMETFTDSVSGNKIITSRNNNGLVPENEEYTRVDYMRARWEFTKLPNNTTSIEYFISTKISNSLPDWLIEKAITYSPIKSIEALREIVE